MNYSFFSGKMNKKVELKTFNMVRYDSVDLFQKE